MKKLFYIFTAVMLSLNVAFSKTVIKAVFPADGAKDVNTGILEWSGKEGSQFDLYFGTDSDPVLYKSNLKKMIEKPVIIGLNKKYYWKVVEKQNDIVVGTSKVFSFTTLPIQLNPSLKYNSFIDSRDGRVYWTIKIGGKEWMAQNLDYDLSGRSWYFSDSVKNKVYGRLYSGEAVSSSASDICPEGWRIPSEDDWRELLSELGGEKKAGLSLKESSGKLWSKSKNPGNNESGMTVLPSGSRDSKPSYSNLGKYAFFWTSTPVPKKPENYYKIDLGFMRDQVNISSGSAGWGYSIRCVKD